MIHLYLYIFKSLDFFKLLIEKQIHQKKIFLEKKKGRNYQAK